MIPTTTATAEATTTTEPAENKTNDVNDTLREELIFRQHMISQKIKNDLELQNQESKHSLTNSFVGERLPYFCSLICFIIFIAKKDDQTVTVVSTLVGLIGLLVLTIFGLLLLFRK